jgi:galactokinase
VLCYGPLQPLIYGGKGVGSQGDGSAQLVARSAQAQQLIIEMLDKELGMAGVPITLHPAETAQLAPALDSAGK